MRWKLNRRDLFFMIKTLMPGRGDKEHTADLIQEDEQFIEAMLDDDRLFQRLVAEEEALLQVSPWLFFTVLLRQARRGLEHELFTVERHHRQKVVVFDVDRVIQLLEQEPLRDYLATMLASFTRIESILAPVQVGEGTWYWYRTNDFDVDGLIRYCQALEKEFRFESYKRIADVCLFLIGMFPEYIEAQQRYPRRRQFQRSRQDYEAYGRTFYRMAAGHKMAQVEGLDGVLTMLSDHFILAEKPLTFLANRYLRVTRHKLFGL